MPGKKTASKYDPVPSHKTCTKCKETKEIDLFSKGKAYPHGRRPTCKRCDAEYVASRSDASKREKKAIDNKKFKYPNIPCDMKQCKDCFGIKSKKSFRKVKQTKDGHSNTCNECFSKKRPSRAGCEKSKELWRRYYEKNREKILDSMRNSEERKEYARKRYAEKSDYIKKVSSEYAKTPTAKAMNARRQRARNANMSAATPKWLSDEQVMKMNNMYWLAQDLKCVSGQVYHVDHIVPLKGKNVCGLHVPWNLQILPADLNCKKSNRA